MNIFVCLLLLVCSSFYGIQADINIKEDGLWVDGLHVKFEDQKLIHKNDKFYEYYYKGPTTGVILKLNNDGTGNYTYSKTHLDLSDKNFLPGGQKGPEVSSENSSDENEEERSIENEERVKVNLDGLHVDGRKVKFVDLKLLENNDDYYKYYYKGPKTKVLIILLNNRKGTNYKIEKTKFNLEKFTKPIITGKQSTDTMSNEIVNESDESNTQERKPHTQEKSGTEKKFLQVFLENVCSHTKLVDKEEK